MPNKTLELECRAASLAPTTFNADDNTVEVVLSTGADVQRGGYIERLPVSNAELDTLAPSFDFLPDLLHDSTVGMIFGPPGSGKTFFAIHLLCCAALGRVTFGMKPEKRRGLYVGLEGESGIKARVMAWVAANEGDASPIHYAVGGFAIISEGDKDVSDLIEYIRNERIEFVVIDTWSLAMSGLDEISGQHMSAGINALHRIKRETGACVVVVAHTGKNEKAGIRGHSSQTGNVDTTIELVVQNKRRVEQLTSERRVGERSSARHTRLIRGRRGHGPRHGTPRTPAMPSKPTETVTPRTPRRGGRVSGCGTPRTASV
jgi:RecA-family ATPase